MFTLKSINQEIYDLEDGKMTETNRAKLADLYIIRDHLQAEYGDITVPPELKSQTRQATMPPDNMDDMYTVDMRQAGTKQEPEAQPLFGPSQSKKPVMSRAMANEWVSNMVNADGTRGGHWTLEQTNQFMAAKNIQADPIKFWVAMCATYSDLCEAFRKNGVGKNMALYIDVAMAFWLNDEDAVDDKLAAYYADVVKHD